MGEKRNVYRLLVGKPEGKRPLGRPRRRWVDNIKMDLLEIGVSVVDWIGLAQDRYRWRAIVKAVTAFFTKLIKSRLSFTEIREISYLCQECTPHSSSL
jgi:hypothetical protein